MHNARRGRVRPDRRCRRSRRSWSTTPPRSATYRGSRPRTCTEARATIGTARCSPSPFRKRTKRPTSIRRWRSGWTL